MTRYWDDDIGNQEWEPVKWDKSGEKGKIKKIKKLTYSRELGNAILAARRRHNLSQKKVADHLHVKQSLINSYEIGDKVPEDNVITKLNKLLKTQLPRKK